VDVPAGRPLSAGRILVRGARVAAGGAWLDTGDTGWLDARGRLWLMGRRANAVRVADGWLFPAQIEPAVEALDWVGGAALVNAAGSSGGGRAIVACEPRARGSAAQRRRWQRELEALSESRGWPVRALVLPRLPRDARSGSKIDYPRLAALAERSTRPRPDTEVRGPAAGTQAAPEAAPAEARQKAQFALNEAWARIEGTRR
jgi:acyl-coenzyme A synthetase/AMP-(fatty) acid ligase